VLSWLLGKSKISVHAAELHLDRVRFLMEYLEQHALKDKKAVVVALNRELLLKIPLELQDPEGRHWFDPSNKNLAISFTCNDRSHSSRVNQFVITGFEQLANTLFIGTVHGGGDKTVVWWSASVESDMRDVPPLAKAVQEAFWKMPGWKLIDGFGRQNWLQRLHT